MRTLRPSRGRLVGTLVSTFIVTALLAAAMIGGWYLLLEFGDRGVVLNMQTEYVQNLTLLCFWGIP